MKKNSSKFICCIFIISTLAASAFAAEGKIVLLEGKIRGFDTKKVQISTAKGVVSVPRDAIPKEIKLKPDQDVKIPVLENQISK